jgi:hypothetical protein
MHDPKIVDVVYRNRYNFELVREFEFNIPNVIGVVKTKKLRYTGHMIRGDETKEDRNPGRRMALV